MQKWLLTGLCAVLLITNAYAQGGGAYAERVQNYIERFRDLAIAEQIRTGVPAAITLAQGIHETSAGASELATEANNHFGIKCKKEWRGQTFAHTDDAPNECFRKYNSSEESYKDHSDYLSSQPRYASLFKLSATDYAAWAIGLRQAGYATNPRYAFVLIGLIEDYKLQEYTYAALNDGTYGNFAVVKKEVVPNNDPVTKTTGAGVPAGAAIPAVAAAGTKTATQTFTSSKNSRLVVKQSGNAEDPDLAATPKPQYGQVVNVNGLKAVYAKKGDMPLEYAFKHSIRYAKLLEMNDLSDRPLPSDMYIYLEKKHSKGLKPMHIVKPGETMIQVAQAEGVQLKSLRSFNMMNPDDEPMPGTTLELQRNASARPRLVGEAVAANTPPPAAVQPAQQQPKVAAAQQPVSHKTTVRTTPPAVASATVTAPVVKAPATAATTPKQPVTANSNYIEKSKIEEAKAPVENVPVDPSIRKKREEYIASTVAATPAAKPIETKYTNEEDNKHTDIAYANKVETTREEPVAEQSVPVKQAVVREEIKEEPVVAITPVKTEAPVMEDDPEEEEVATTKQPDTKAPATTKQPADELDALKAKFDMVVYTNDKNTEPADKKAEPAAGEKQDTASPAAKANVAAPNADAKFYTVKKGDTAFIIAKNNNITVRQLMEWNSLDFEAIKVGQKLRVK